MQKLNALINNLRKNYPNLTFTESDRYQFSPPNQILFDPQNPEPLLLLHEIGHFLTQHYDYSNDIELLRIESSAWQEAKNICSQYDISWDEDFAESRLDSYRDWLHACSLCKNCQLNGYQDKAGLYHCPLCDASWPSRFRPE